MADKMPLMKCGHRAQGYRTSPEPRIPACVICAGITPDAYIVVEEPDELSRRTARCTYYGKKPVGRNPHRCKQPDGTMQYLCLCERSSSDNLAFFKHKPGAEHNEFYCGCWGWD